MFFTFFSIALGALLLSRSLFLPSLRLSYKIGAIDYPNKRKSHLFPTARAGGISFFASFIIFLAFLPISQGIKTPLLLGASIIFAVGIIDDTQGLSAFQKLAGQFLSASVYVLIRGSNNTVLDLVSFVWIIFLTNAINLIDGINGLAAGVSCSQSLCLCILALIYGNFSVFLCSLLLLSTLIGFLPQNFPRAMIFMGDCGALFLGFTLGVLSSTLVFESESIICLISTLLIFRVPTYDTNLSIIRRLLKRKNPFKADRGHFHHRLVDSGFTKECTALLLTTVSLALGLLGIILSSI